MSGMLRAGPDDQSPDAAWSIDAIGRELRDAREEWRARHRRDPQSGFPSRRAVRAIVDDLSAALFPSRLGQDDDGARDEDGYVHDMLERALGRLTTQVRREWIYEAGPDADDTAPARAIVGRFARRLPAIRRLLDSDVEAAFAGDPAARSVDEILLCYPGMTATIYYRLAHELHRGGAPLIARIIADIAHSDTAIDIHPGATISDRFFIDHGTGVVIGETAVIGRGVRIYQAVTLGARSFPRDENGALSKGIARHPLIGDDVIIYAGATILGRVTIGAGSVIGGNVWLTEDVAPGSVIHQALAERERGGAAIPNGRVLPERVAPVRRADAGVPG
ncbi:serine O-acetyltransferase EpsC [Sphingomonas sp. 2SG]|uniref:serine O-acetyltransferase EpsC n=1 Tax=Sphingomonas sp. 2SG TaxID=2502201 RepID=UPI0020169727|nr:serine O-acetyltransferase EpsC [Sphingomonas sp. 2SG]